MKKIIVLVFLMGLITTQCFAAQLCVDISDAEFTRVVDSYAKSANYQVIVPDGVGGEVVNPESKLDFVLRVVKNRLKQTVVAEETKQASVAAAKIAKEKAEAEIVIT